MNEVVYFARLSDGPVKIGVTSYPARRLRQLRHRLGDGLRFVATIDGDYVTEARFHAAFRHLHIEGEWFVAGPDLLAAIAAISAKSFDLDALPPPSWWRRSEAATLRWRRQRQGDAA